VKRGGTLRRRKPLRSRGPARKMVTAQGRAGGTCEARTRACTGRGVHDHHVVRPSRGGRDEIDNLLWVCAPCHGYIHEHPAESYERGWLRRGGAPSVLVEGGE